MCYLTVTHITDALHVDTGNRNSLSIIEICIKVIISHKSIKENLTVHVYCAEVLRDSEGNGAFFYLSMS